MERDLAKRRLRVVVLRNPGILDVKFILEAELGRLGDLLKEEGVVGVYVGKD